MSTAWPDTVLAVYVLCHPEKEAERFRRLMPHLEAVGIPADRLRVCAPTWGTDLTVEQIFANYSPFLARGGCPSFSFKAANLTRGEISLALNLQAAIVHAVRATEKEDGRRSVIILESDVWLRADFVPRLRDLLASAAGLAPNWDYISLSEGVGTRPPGCPVSYFTPEKAWLPPHEWVFRCTDSMLFSVDYLRRLSQTVLPFKECTDWEMNFQMMLHRGVALWADPPMVEQGTCYNRIESSLH